MIEKFEVWCSPAGENRRIHLYLPDDYYVTEEHYPVLYMFDGHNLYYDGEATAIAGYSMGGMMALFAVLRYNQYFSKSAVISPALIPAMENFKQEIAGSNYDGDTRIFFSWGTDEDSKEEVWNLSQSILYLEKEVQKKGIRTWIHCQIGGHHNEESWQKQVPEWMHFLWF